MPVLELPYIPHGQAILQRVFADAATACGVQLRHVHLLLGGRASYALEGGGEPNDERHTRFEDLARRLLVAAREPMSGYEYLLEQARNQGLSMNEIRLELPDGFEVTDVTSWQAKVRAILITKRISFRGPISDRGTPVLWIGGDFAAAEAIGKEISDFLVDQVVGLVASQTPSAPPASPTPSAPPADAADPADSALDAPEAAPPSIFISYSWDNEEHKQWVLKLAEDLQKRHGVLVTLDRWHLVPGAQLPHFMESSIEDTMHTVLVCTPQFAAKANAGQGGVGYEKAIVSAKVFSGFPAERFIPVVRTGDAIHAVPTYLQGKYFLDFRDDAQYDSALLGLARALHKRPALTPPPLGKPSF